MENDKKWSEIVAEKDARITELEALVKFYEEQFRLLNAGRFGQSSEKGLLPGQIGLFGETAQDKPEPGTEKISYMRRKRVGKRGDDLSGLPVEVVEYKLDEYGRTCPECDGQMHEMGRDSRREIKIIPVKVLEHRRAVYSCRNCEKRSP